MWKWKMAEPSLQDLLDDQIMVPVMRSAGLDAGELRELLAELAKRLPVKRLFGCSGTHDPRLPAA